MRKTIIYTNYNIITMHRDKKKAGGEGNVATHYEQVSSFQSFIGPTAPSIPPRSTILNNNNIMYIFAGKKANRAGSASEQRQGERQRTS